jgi:hypothetical protein
MARIQGSYPDITYMDDYISDGQSAILRLENFYETIQIENTDGTDKFIIPWSDFFLKYRRELSEITEWKTIPESMFYQPKTASLEMYGTTELWIALLRVNNMKTVADFHYPIIRAYNASNLMDLINIYFKRNKVLT